MPILRKTSLEDDLIHLEKFARSLRSLPDGRPDWLKAEVDEPDDRAHYYRFLYELVQAERPTRILETGTRHGHSAAHLAVGNPEARVITIDIDPEAKVECDALGLPNVTALTRDSVLASDEVGKTFPEIDLIFIDSAHVYSVASSEWMVYRPKLRHWGIAIFDDVRINPEMTRFWESIEDPKVELGFLHYMGFGVAIKDSCRNYRG